MVNEIREWSGVAPFTNFIDHDKGKNVQDSGIETAYTRRMTTRRSEFLNGIKAELPILMGTIPFGLIYGVSARSFGIPTALAQAMSLIVFAGSAQFVVIQLINASVPAGIILLTACIINLRHALYSASVAPYLKERGLLWRLLLPYLLTDEAYAVAITHYQQPDQDAPKHWYFLGAGVTLWATWQVGTAVGLTLGAHIPASWSLDFTLPLTFIALVIPTLKKRSDAIAAGSAGLIAVLAARLPFNSGLLMATFIGIALGLLVETKDRRAGVNSTKMELPQDQPEVAVEIAENVPRSYQKEEGQQ